MSTWISLQKIFHLENAWLNCSDQFLSNMYYLYLFSAGESKCESAFSVITNLQMDLFQAL